MSLLFLVLILFLIMNPMGNVIHYLNLMREIPLEKRRMIGLREMGLALLIMLLFYFIGDSLFDWLKFSEIGLRIASGLILFLIALKILFPPANQPQIEFLPGEPYVFPLAVPLIAGPALLATVMLYSHLEPSKPMMLLAILIAWTATSTILFLSPYLERILGSSGLAASEKLLAMVLVLLSVQRLSAGLQLFITGKCCD